MRIAATIAIAFVALEHFWILVLEMFLWTKPLGRRTFGLTEEANLTRKEGSPHQLLASASYFTALDDPIGAKLSAIVRTAAR